MKGRKPKTIQAQLASGDPRKHGVHKLEEKLASEPKAPRGLPECPEHLIGRARESWIFWADELAAMDLDRRPDAIMLEGACVGYQRAVKADLLLEVEGLIVEECIVGEEGEKVVLKRKEHPAVKISREAWAQVRAFSGEFGLSPVSRTRLTIEKKDDGAEDLMAILSAPRIQKQPHVN